MTDLLPPIADGQIVEEKKDIYEPFWQYKKNTNVFVPTLFNKFAKKHPRQRGKGARITFA